MKDNIVKICKEIEKTENIRILFCVESGSRSWEMSSINSDYDVRFVYVRPLKEYIQIDKRGEVISKHYNENFQPCAQEGCFIDLCGFDIFKFTKMLSSSNPTVIEWLRSDILYYGEINKIFKKYAEKSFKKISIYFHYKSMCKQNYLKYIKSRDDLSYKRYLYAMRGLINAKYVAKFGKLPPISFPKTINESKELIPDYVYKKLINILELKKQCKEKDIIQNIVCMDSYIESVLGDDKDAPKEKQLTPKTELDNELRKIVLTFG